jgi:hypothetical protein
MTKPVVLSLLDQPPAESKPAAVGMLEPPDGWPAPPGAAAYHALVGEIVQTIAPETEADR